MGCSPTGSSVHGILQARILEWVAIPSPGDLPHPGIDPVSLTSPALTGGFFTASTTWEAQMEDTKYLIHCHFPKMFITRTFACLFSAMSALLMD